MRMRGCVFDCANDGVARVRTSKQWLKNRRLKTNTPNIVAAAICARVRVLSACVRVCVCALYFFVGAFARVLCACVCGVCV